VISSNIRQPNSLFQAPILVWLTDSLRKIRDTCRSGPTW